METALHRDTVQDGNDALLVRLLQLCPRLVGVFARGVQCGARRLRLGHQNVADDNAVSAHVELTGICTGKRKKVSKSC